MWLPRRFKLLHEWCHVKRFAACSVYTIQQCRFIRNHICRMHVCLAVTCHLHFRQNNRDLLHATVVIWEWNGYRNKIQLRKLTLEKNWDSPAWTQSRELSITSPARVKYTNNELSPLPIFVRARVCTFVCVLACVPCVCVCVSVCACACLRVDMHARCCLRVGHVGIVGHSV